MTQTCDISSDRSPELRNLSNGRVESGSRNHRQASLDLRYGASALPEAKPECSERFALVSKGATRFDLSYQTNWFDVRTNAGTLRPVRARRRARRDRPPTAGRSPRPQQAPARERAGRAPAS